LNHLLLQVCIQLLAHVKNAGSNTDKAELSSQTLGANRGMFHPQDCGRFTLGEKLRSSNFIDRFTHEMFVHVATNYMADKGNASSGPAGGSDRWA
jgi:hypothetical protein